MRPSTAACLLHCCFLAGSGCHLVFPFEEGARDAAVDAAVVDAAVADQAFSDQAEVDDGQPPDSGTTPDGPAPDVLKNTVITLAGVPGEQGHKDGPAGQALFSGPAGIAVAKNGDIYVTEEYNHTIRHISGGVVTTIAGDPKQYGSFKDGSVATALFNSPSGIAIDLNGDLIVADFGNDRVRRISNTSGMVTTEAGSSVEGWQDGPALQATFDEPHEVAIDSSGAIFVAEYNQCLVRKIENGVVTTVAGTPPPNNCAYKDGSTTDAQLQLPAGLDVDGQGRIYVADSSSSTVRLIEPAKGLVSTAAGIGWGYQDGPAASAKFRTPADVVLGPAGKLYIVEFDGHRVRLLQGGVVTTVAGIGTPGHVDGDPLSAKFDGLHSVAVDQSGAVYVTDFFGNTVRKIYP
jgi:hypothetical protein